MTTYWKRLIEEMQRHNENGFDIVECSVPTELLYQEIDDEHGNADCMAFTVWTANRVYFSDEYEGSIRVKSVQRNPQ